MTYDAISELWETIVDKIMSECEDEKPVMIAAVNKYGIKVDWKEENVDWVHLYDDDAVKAFKKKKGKVAERISEPGTYAMEYKINAFIPAEKLINRMCAGLNNALSMLKALSSIVVADK